MGHPASNKSVGVDLGHKGSSVFLPATMLKVSGQGYVEFKRVGADHLELGLTSIAHDLFPFARSRAQLNEMITFWTSSLHNTGLLF